MENFINGVPSYPSYILVVEQIGAGKKEILGVYSDNYIAERDRKILLGKIEDGYFPQFLDIKDADVFIQEYQTNFCTMNLIQDYGE